MAKKSKKQNTYSGIPYNRSAQLSKAKSLTNTAGAEPTIDTFSNIQGSDDITRPSNDNDVSDKIRPTKKSFNIGEYFKEVIVAIVIGVGAYLVYNKIQLSLLEKDVEKNTKSIESIEVKQDKVNSEINNLKNETNLINYRLEKMESKIEKPNK